MTVGYRSHTSQYEAHLRIGSTQRIHYRKVVLDEFVAIVGPVARVGIVDAEGYHGNVALEGERLLKLLLHHLGAVAVIEQRGTGLAEVAHYIPLAQHTLQLRWIGVAGTVLDTGAVGDTVAYASHTYGLRLLLLLARCRCLRSIEGKHSEQQCREHSVQNHSFYVHSNKVVFKVFWFTHYDFAKLHKNHRKKPVFN